MTKMAEVCDYYTSILRRYNVLYTLYNDNEMSLLREMPIFWNKCFFLLIVVGGIK